MRRLVIALGLAFVCLALLGPSAQAAFNQYQLESVFDSLSNTQAGAHSDFTTKFEVSEENGRPYATTSDIVVRLPPGLLGDPKAFPTCTPLELGLAPIESKCPQDSQVGTTAIKISGALSGVFPNEPVYNMPVRGGDMVARFGFYAVLFPMFINVRLDPQTESLVASVDGAPSDARLVSAMTTLWGVPSAAIHDQARITPLEAVGRGGAGRASSFPEIPFMINPTSCEGGQQVTTTVDSYQLPGQTFTKSAPFPQITGCDAVEFSPSSLLLPTTSQATTGTGLDYQLEFPDKGLQFGNIPYGSELKRAEVVLPDGVTINPSAGVGLGVCSEADLARETYDSPPNAGCPETSKIGSMTAASPVIDRKAEGALYLAKPYENPFGSLLAVYVVVKIPDRGVLVKEPGQVKLGPQTGRITTIFDDIPQLPMSEFHLHFREGARAPLVTPSACGVYTAISRLTPWSSPSSVLVKENVFGVETGPNHGPCQAGSKPSFAPTAIAGTQSNTAASYSPFYLQLTRGDGEQEITKFSTVMPKGLTGNLTGIPFCSDAAIETARHKTGREELAEPSCPAASEIGHSLVGAGVGEVLAETPGKIYLAGPYHGSALSVVSVTSATVGPFDLGTVVIRFALRINPTTGQVEIDSNGSDPIPHILDGIVVHVRDIRVYIDREKFIMNPTNCHSFATANTITGTGANIATPADDTNANITSRFQVLECQRLKFTPHFSASTSGKTSRTRGASLHVNLAFPAGALGKQANISSVKVELPKQLPSRLSTLQQACTDTTFDQDPAACPASSRVGYAKAITPILPVPLEGPAYFVSHGGLKWPELIVVLQGYGVTIDLHGETFINKGVTSSTFRTVPDQPVSSFQLSLPQGENSALSAPSNLCHITRTVLVKHKTHAHGRKMARKVRNVAGSLIMPTTFTAQNGIVIHQNTKIAITDCARHKTRKARHAARR